MNRVLNHMKMQAALQMGALVNTKVGLVDSYDPKTYSCKVRLQPEDPDNPSGSLTGWLPISSMWAGNGFGILAPPAYDQQVLVHFIDGDLDSGIVSGMIFNGITRPVVIPQGECHIIHRSGSFLKFLNDGTISTDATINHRGDLNVDGNITATGDVSDSKGSMDTMRDQHNEHDHTGDGNANPPAPTSTPVNGRME